MRATLAVGRGAWSRALRSWRSMLPLLIVLPVLPVLTGCTTAGREAGAPARLALVIGNAAYENAPRLNNPTHDAEDMCKALRALGFVTLCHTNLRTRAEFAARLDDYLGRLGPGTAGVVYYAGHGVQVGGANFLVPTQGQPEGNAANPLASLFGVDDLFERLRERPARVNIVILDACRTELFDDAARPASGRGAGSTAAPAAATAPAATAANAPRTRLLRALQALPRSAAGLATIRDAPPRTVVLYATASKSAAFDGDDRNGPLTRHVLRHIATRGQPLEDFFKRVTDGVETETLRDVGKRQSPFTYGSFAGRFCFAGCPGDDPPPPPIN
jgi:uncharacterized caspase-like protein